VARRSDGSVVAWGSNSSDQTKVPALPPGLTYAGVAVGGFHTVALVQSGSYLIFAPGCPGSLGVPTLTVASPPRVGQAMRVLVERLPQSLALVLCGASNTTSPSGPLPLDLSRFGMPGCRLAVSLDVEVLVAGTSGWARLSVPIPPVPSFVGASFYLQAIVADPNAGNALGLVLSDAGTAVVGF
jgi:hypothetical protein